MKPTTQEAIDTSIRENRIVHLTAQQLDTMYEPVVADLMVECEDWAAADELEFWGGDNDGDQWRVHVERRTA